MSNAFDLMLTASQRLSSQSQSHKSGKKRRSSQPDSQPRERSYEICPFCTGQFPTSILSSHVEECERNQRSSVRANDREPDAMPMHMATHDELEGKRLEENGSQHKDKGIDNRPASNAFDIIMKQQRKNSERQVFSLEHSPGSGWRWSWSKREGKEDPSTVPVKWSASTSVSQGGPAGGKGSDSPSINILLTSNLPSASGVSWTTEGLLSNQDVPPEGRWQGGTGFSVMKSALQKAIRLGRAPCAVRILVHLLKDSAQEALRRMPVIVLEDSILHPSYPFLVWCMVAQAKGFQLGPEHFDEILRITHEVSSIRIRDFLPPSTSFKAPCPSFSLTQVDGLDLSYEESSLVRSIHLRASFGGMKGDVAMLKGYSSYWASRFLGHLDPPPSSLSGSPKSSWMAYLKSIYLALPPPPRQLISVLTVGPLRLSDIPLSAIDYHVSNVIDKLMEDPRVRAKAAEITRGCWGEEGDAAACLSSAMWLFRSSVNVRRWVCHEAYIGNFMPASSLVKQSSVEALELEADIERDEAKKERLMPLWEVAKPVADSFAIASLKRRFSWKINIEV